MSSGNQREEGDYGYGTTAYASGDASITTYKLGARQDDSYISTFKSIGWWNADRLRDN